MTLTVERDLFQEYQHATGAERAELENELIQEHQGLAYGIAHSFPSVEDRESIALMGLLKAVRSFDPRKGFKFSTFAFPTIRHSLLLEVRRNQTNIRKANLASTSLDAPIRDQDGKGLRLMDTLVSDFPDLSETMIARDMADKIRRAIDQLPPAQRDALFLSMQGLSYEEMAEARGVTTHAIRGALGLARKCIRNYLRNADPESPVPEDGRGKRWTAGEKQELRKMILGKASRIEIRHKFSYRPHSSVDNMSSLIRKDLRREGLL